MIDRLAFDLRQAFPDMDGFSSRNVKYMRAFAEAWPSQQIVQRVVARLPWGQNLTLLERLDDPATRIWYAEQVIAQGWSLPIFILRASVRGPYIHKAKPLAKGLAKRVLGTRCALDEE